MLGRCWKNSAQYEVRQASAPCAGIGVNAWVCVCPVDASKYGWKRAKREKQEPVSLVPHLNREMLSRLLLLQLRPMKLDRELSGAALATAGVGSAEERFVVGSSSMIVSSEELVEEPRRAEAMLAPELGSSQEGSFAR